MSAIKTRILSLILAGVCFWLLLLTAAAQVRYMNGSRQLQAVKDRIDVAQNENNKLSRELELMRRPDWLALLARGRLNYKRPDETVVFVYKDEKSGTIVPPRQQQDDTPNWQKWINWLAGRQGTRD